MTTIFSTSTTKDLELRRLGLFQVPTEIVGSAELRKCKHEKNKTKQKTEETGERQGLPFPFFQPCHLCAFPSLLCLPNHLRAWNRLRMTMTKIQPVVRMGLDLGLSC